MANKPSLAKGTRDFSSVEVNRRQYIMNIIKKNFELFGFAPIETPSFENSETLLGKYGEEGDRLIFKILNSGDFLSKVDDNLLLQKNALKIAPQITEKALRYDLTVPFARYVVMHQNDLTFPFKRYQIQPVWRADRPQKGRFREFYQCDADVIGSKSLTQEVELIKLYDQVFFELGLSTTIKINNRKILSGIAEIMQAQDLLIDFTVALDKLDKIGLDAVKEEMLSKGIQVEAIEKMLPLITFTGTNQDKLNLLSDLLKSSAVGLEGIQELTYVLNTLEGIGIKNASLRLDITLARGLNYYTGCILEVASNEVALGSVGGGGRYDDLTGIFGLNNMSGVGISFGLDRIYLVLESLNLFPAEVSKTIDVMFMNHTNLEDVVVFKAIDKLRAAGLVAEYYPDNVKSDKQFKYAQNKQVVWLVRDVKDEVYEIKNLITNEVIQTSLNDFILKIS